MFVQLFASSLVATAIDQPVSMVLMVNEQKWAPKQAAGYAVDCVVDAFFLHHVHVVDSHSQTVVASFASAEQLDQAVDAVQTSDAALSGTIDALFVNCDSIDCVDTPVVFEHLLATVVGCNAAPGIGYCKNGCSYRHSSSYFSNYFHL
mgnify:CR=1 FL=1